MKLVAWVRCDLQLNSYPHLYCMNPAVYHMYSTVFLVYQSAQFYNKQINTIALALIYFVEILYVLTLLGDYQVTIT
jgi:hypothetical protein